MRDKLFLFIALIGLLASCTSVRHTADAVPVNTKIVSFTVADMNVSPQKISKTTTWNFDLFNRVSIETIKDNTTAQMLKDANADVLVEPEYIIEKRGFLRGGSVTVIGFPATYTNFHKMTPEEAAVFKSVEECKKEKRHKKRFLIF